MKVRKAVIPAAGLGTRFLPATKAQPKEMLPLVDKPTIQYIVEEAVNAGITDIIIISGRGKRAIEDHFDKSYELEDMLTKKKDFETLETVKKISDMANIYYVRQKEPKGLGHAILCAKSFIGNHPFAVMLGDDVVDAEKPCIGQLIDVFDQYQKTIIGVQPVKKENVCDYGIVDCQKVDNRIYKIRDMVEKPDIDKAPSNIAILGRYIITPDIFDLLENLEPGKGGEIQLTDALKKLLMTDEAYAYDFVGTRYDVGKKIGFLQATIEFALKRDDLNKEFKEYLINLTKNM
ncbi:MAG: UTP--glucose-1-phosphate uridylyltransferase GalU [Clostridia bacterium]|nr:UTP--glucose-1-phosphate uridylyltransferase GalU [Clostridia bacterium]